MIAPNRLTPMGSGYKGWRCGLHDLASTVAGWKCPKCPTDLAPNRALSREAGYPGSDVVAASTPRGSKPRRNVCTLGHAHDSHGEAVACPRVYAAAAHAGLTTFRPGRPGIPCFRVAADDNGRPCYVSIDWVLVNDAGKIACLLDWKGEASHRSWQGRGGAFARGKRIIEAETGVPVAELQEVEDIEKAIAASRGAGGGS